MASAQVDEFKTAIVTSLPRAALVSVAVVLGSVIALPPASQVLAKGLFADDAFYYFEIAANIVANQGISFDTINATNGFQVLWLLLLLPMAVLIKDPDNFVTAVWWMQVILGAVAAGLAFMMVYSLVPRARTWIPAAIIIATLPFMPLWNGGMVNGLETPAFIVAVLASLLLLENYRRAPTTQRAWLAGIALTIALLGRLDGLLLVALAGVAVWWWRSGTVRQRIQVVALPLSVSVAYFGTNLLAFGSMSPVSGATKTIWGERALQAAIEAGASGWRLRLSNVAWPKQYLEPAITHLPDGITRGLVLDSVIILAVVGLYVGAAWFYWQQGMQILVLFQVFLIGKFLVYGYMQFGHADYIWYWTPDLIGIVLFVSVAVEKLLARRQLSSTLIALGLGVGTVVFGFLGNSLVERGRADFAPDPSTGEIAEYAGGKYASLTLNDSEVTKDLLLTSTDAGILGFYLQSPLVNIDGLVNGRERLEVTKQHGAESLPYFLAHPEFDGFVNWVPVISAERVVERSRRAGFVEVPGFANCVAAAHGVVANDRGSIRLFLRPAFAQSWKCPVLS